MNAICMYTNQEDEPPAKAKWQSNEPIFKKKNAYIYQRWQEFSQGGAHQLHEVTFF